MLAVLVTEWGQVLAAAAALTFLPGWSKTRGGKTGAALGLAAILLAASPLMRAAALARRVPGDMDLAFGKWETTRPPLLWRNLFIASSHREVLETTELYARGCDDQLFLQLYRPKTATAPVPVIMIAHGGSWQSGSRREHAEFSRYFAARGYAVASIDYGLAPRTVFPGPVEDMRDALAFLTQHAREWSLDMSRVVLMGRSAGGQIALAAAHDPEPFPGIKGVIVFYAPNDLHLAWAAPGPKRIIDSRTLLRRYLGGSPAEQPRRYDLASPIQRVGPLSPPTLMIHGGRDELVWPLHERRLTAKLSAAGVANYYLELPWATHGCDYNFNGPCGQISTYAVERFLAGVTASVPPLATRKSSF